MSKKKAPPPRTDFDLNDLIEAGYTGTRRNSTEGFAEVGPETQRLMDGGAPATPRGIGGAAKDTVVQLAEGANSILGAIPSLVAPDSRAAKFFDKNAEYWRDAQSEDIKARTQAASRHIDAAGEDGVIAQVVEAARQYSSDPALAARFVVTNLPSLIPGIAAGKVAQAASLAKSAKAAGVAVKALDATAKARAAAAATTAGGLMNAALNAGGARGEAYKEIKEAAIKSGMSEQEAHETALARSWAPAAVGGVAGFISGKTGLEHSLFGAGTSKSAIKAGAASVAAEMGGEQLEEVAPQLATNTMASQFDGRDITKNIGRTIVETAIGAGPSSLISGGVEARNAKQAQQQAIVDTAKASGGIVSRAGLAANGHPPTQSPPATPAPATATPPNAQPAAMADDAAPSPASLAAQEIEALRSEPDLDEVDYRRLQFLEANITDEAVLADFYGLPLPAPEPTQDAQPDPAPQPEQNEAPATEAGVSASGGQELPGIDPITGEILGATTDGEPPSAGEPPPAPVFDEHGHVMPDEEALAQRDDDELRAQRINAKSSKVRQAITDELTRRGLEGALSPDGIDVSETASWRRSIGKAKKLADQLGIPHRGMKLPALVKAIELATGTRTKDVGNGIAGEKINDEWTAFSEQSGTLGIPRAEMPQVKAEHRGAMVNFLKAKGIDATPETIPSAAVKPTQAEFSPEKVKSAMEFTGGDRAIIVSADGHVVDGHHQWLAKREKGEPIKALRLDTNIREVLDALKDMPSAQPEQAAPGTELAISHGQVDSKQFTSYANWINDGKIVSPGMREQISADERLNEGEADRLLAMADERGDGKSYAVSNARQEFSGDITQEDKAETLNLPQAIQDLAEALRTGGWDAFTARREEIAARYNLDVRQTLDLGTRTAAVVGPLYGLEMARSNPFKAGRVAYSNGEMPVPPDGLSNEQQAEWLAGWDDGADREPDSSGPKAPGDVVGEAKEVEEVVALPPPELTPEQITERANALLPTVRRYASGLSAIGDLSRGARAAGGAQLSGVGVDVGLISKNAIDVIGNAIVNQQSAVFVDSGAFSAFRRSLKSGEFTPMDFDAILAKYEAITESIGRHAAEAGEQTEYPRPLFVMPDVVGNQAESIALIDEHRAWISAEIAGNLANPIIPIQKGDMTMAEAYRRVVDILGSDNFIVGIPSNEKAVSPDELKAFLEEVKPKAIHILGAASDVKLQPRIESVVAARLDGLVDITADASPIRNKVIRAVAKGAKRGDVIESLLHDKTDPGIAPYYESAPDSEARSSATEDGVAPESRPTQTYKQIVEDELAATLSAYRERGEEIPLTFEQFMQEVEAGKQSGHPVSEVQRELSELREDRAGVEAGRKSPRSIVGKGGTKKEALRWIDGQIARLVEREATGGRSEPTNVSNYRAFLRDALNESKAVEKEPGTVTSKPSKATPDDIAHLFGPAESAGGSAQAIDSSRDAKWRKNWAAARDAAESLGLPTKDGKRNLKLTELVPAIEAKLKGGDDGHAVAMLPADPEVFESALSNLFTEADQARGEDERFAATFHPDIQPVSLPRVTSANTKPDGVEFISKDEAAKVLQSWKDEAERQGKENLSANANRTVISLFDASGVMSQPWIDAGYNVVTYDIQAGEDINDFDAEMLLERHGNDNVWAIIAQPPCTDYASSGARWWADKDKAGVTELSNELVRQTMRTLELFRPAVWWLENPVGRIQELNNLPDPVLSFDPWHFGDQWTKRTNYWGNFNPSLPTAMVEPVEGSKVHKLSSSAKFERSLTPEGVAYAMFMANNAEGMAVADRMAKEFPGISRDLFDAALSSGRNEYDIRTAIEDAYYDSDLEAVRDELAKGAEVPPAAVEKAVLELIEGQLSKAKARLQRAKTQSKSDKLSLEQKLEKQDAVKKLESDLRKMRQSIFAADDAAKEAIASDDITKFSEFKGLFADAYGELAKHVSEPKPSADPAPSVLDGTRLTKDEAIAGLVKGEKLSRHGETVWIDRKKVGVLDTYVVMSKEDDGSSVFTKGPVGASRDIGWSKSEAAEKAVAAWDFDTIPVLEAEVDKLEALILFANMQLEAQGEVTSGYLEQRRADLEAELEKTKARIRDKKMLATSESGAVNDFIEGRRDDAPTVDEVKAEQGANLESIFAGLQADGQTKMEAEQQAAASPHAEKIELVEANFHDALLALMEAGRLKVNGHGAITEDNRACL